MTLISWVFLAVSAVALPVFAADKSFSPTSPQFGLLQKVDFRQRLDQPIPLQGTFRDDQNRTVTISDCMHGRPAVLVLAYYRCPSLCNHVLNGVARSLQAIDLEPGRDFEVIVISIDPAETVELAAAKKRNIVRAFHHDASGNGWHFLVSDPGGEATDSPKALRAPADIDVTALCESVGFRYQYDAAIGQYAHASGIILLTPSGRTSRYFYGIDYPTRDLRLGLVEASQGTIGSPVDQLLLYCFHYDPLTGRYGLAIMRLIRGAALLTVLTMATLIGLSLRRERGRNGTLLMGGPEASPDGRSAQ